MDECTPGAQFDIPQDTLKKLQNVVDIMAELMNIPAALIMRLVDTDIEVFLSSKSHTDGDDFKVSFYDMPMIDYTSVATRGAVWKYSIVLKEVNREKNTVKIAIANLPEETYAASEKYKFDDSAL